MTIPLELHKFPRTPHLSGSRLQSGDQDLAIVPFADIAGKWVTIEEKLDGANAGISFTDEGELLLQSRGHYLTGGPRERQFAPLKAWAASIREELGELLGAKYILYGEWLWAKHTIFYDALPHHFLAFDILDKETGLFLSTARRRALLAGTSVCSVPLLGAGYYDDQETILSMADQPSRCRTDTWRAALGEAADKADVEWTEALGHTDTDDRMEGIYLRIENQDEGRVLARVKWVRPTFTSLLATGVHWSKRPIIVNRIRT